MLRLACGALALAALGSASTLPSAGWFGVFWTLEAVGIALLLAEVRAPWPVWVTIVARPAFALGFVNTSTEMLMAADAFVLVRDGALLFVAAQASRVPRPVFGLAAVGRGVGFGATWLSIQLAVPGESTATLLATLGGVGLAVTWGAAALLGRSSQAPASAADPRALGAVLAGGWLATWAVVHGAPRAMWIESFDPSVWSDGWTIGAFVSEVAVGLLIAAAAGWSGRTSRAGIVAAVLVVAIVGVRMVGLSALTYIFVLRLLLEALAGGMAVGAVWFWLFRASTHPAQRVGAYASLGTFLFLYVPFLTVVMVLRQTSGPPILPLWIWSIQDQLATVPVLIPAVWGGWAATLTYSSPDGP